jgi:CheY-like chemotaxis protein
MPVMSGFEVLETLKSTPSLSNIPVVVLSTATDDLTKEQCRKLGASFYICKPSSAKELSDAIQFVLKIDWNNPPKSFSYCDQPFLH